MVSECCLGELYCHRGIPMLKTRIQLPAISGGQPTDWMLSFAQLTSCYAEQTLLPAVCEVYDSLSSVAEKMHFEPYGYCQIWQAAPHPASPILLTVRILTELSHRGHILLSDERAVTVHCETGMIVKAKKKRTKG